MIFLIKRQFMKKVLKWIKIISLILAGATIGIAVFSFAITQTLWFPKRSVIHLGGAGVEVNVCSYSPWMWNRENKTKIAIFDRKNDGPNFEIKLSGLDDSHNDYVIYRDTIRLIHSGWNLTVVAVRIYSEYVPYYHDDIYILHRIPKANGEESLERQYVPGTILAVAPDETSYFYSTPTTIVRRDWNKKDLIVFNMPEGYEKPEVEPVLFSNQNKLAFNIAKVNGNRTLDGALVIWNLSDDTTKIISITKLFPNYLGGKLTVEDYGVGNLYITKEEMNIKRAKISE
jgi:hypothetical protein